MKYILVDFQGSLVFRRVFYRVIQKVSNKVKELIEGKKYNNFHKKSLNEKYRMSKLEGSRNK